MILNLPEDVLFAWCHANPDHGPAFAGAVLPVLTTRDPQAIEREFHPSIARLIDEFGERNDVQRQIEANIHSFGWMGHRPFTTRSTMLRYKGYCCTRNPAYVAGLRPCSGGLTKRSKMSGDVNKNGRLDGNRAGVVPQTGVCITKRRSSPYH